LFAILLTILPIIELRGGMLVAIHYAIKNNIPLLPIFLLIIVLNIFVIIFLFFFLDFLHKKFLTFKIYRRFFEFYLKRTQRKVERVQNKMKNWGFIALAFFVSIPLPGTGAWTGVLIAWLLNLDRKKSIIAIACGVLIAGVIVFLASLGIVRIL